MKPVLLILLLVATAACSSADTPYVRSFSTEDPETGAEGMSQADTVGICSFNIQFLGHFRNRDNEFLSSLLEEYDLVLIQEMVAPPIDGFYPDGTAYEADEESKAFHEAMLSKGFDFWLSAEDTGPTRNHTVSTASEWWIAYYKKDVVIPDSLSRSYGFLDTVLVHNANYERVPYAFPFRTLNGELDFTLISVHLAPGGSSGNKARRKTELGTIDRWIMSRTEANRDFFIVGDCNVEDSTELRELSMAAQWYDQNGILSLNKDCRSTNTKLYENSEKGRPYDHVFYDNPSMEDLLHDFLIIDLLFFSPEGGDPSYRYDHDAFRTKYSDHLPVSFRLITGNDSD